VSYILLKRFYGLLNRFIKMKKTANTQTPRVRITDIAEAAGVSASTVSFVLNGRAKEMRVSDTVVSRVREAARALGYVPHVSARRLRARRGSTEPLALAIVTSLETPLVLAGPILRGVQVFGAELLEREGVPLQIAIETFQHGLLKDLPGLLEGTRFNGAIVTNTIPADDQFLESARCRTPMVLFNRILNGYSCVYTDEDQVGRDMARHCLAQGATHPCIVRPGIMTQSVERRYRGFLTAFAEAQRAPAQEILCAGLDEFAARAAVLAHLDQGGQVDALYALTSVLAVGARVALRLRGREPHRTVLFLGEDYHLAALRDPALTSFDHPSVAMAREAARLLVEIMRTGPVNPVRVRFDGSRIVAREVAEKETA